MRRHVLRIAGRTRSEAHLAHFAAVLFIATLACGGNQPPGDPAQLSASEAWVQRGCHTESFDTAGWPRYRVGDVTIAVPPEYPGATAVPYAMVFRRNRNNSLGVQLVRDNQSQLDYFMQRAPRNEAWCYARYGKYDVEVRSSYEKGVYSTSLRMPAYWGGKDEGHWLQASLRASTLEDATVLRHAMRTLASVSDTARSP